MTQHKLEINATMPSTQSLGASIERQCKLHLTDMKIDY